MLAQGYDSSPFQPRLTDPRNAQRFARPPDSPSSRSEAPLPKIPSGAGSTGFETTGAIRKRQQQRKAGQRNLGGKPAPPIADPYSAPPRPPLPQTAARAAYADVYRAPDAPRRRSRTEEADPFEPLGVRYGDFVLRPAIDVVRGHDSNPARTPNGRGSGFTTVSPELLARSQWSRHELNIQLRGSYSRYDRAEDLNRPSADARAIGRIDVTRDTQIDLEGRFLLGTDNPGSPNLSADLERFPIYANWGATAGVTQRFNRLEVSVKGLADRTRFQDSRLTDGSRSSNRDRDYDQFGGQIRAGYEVTPGIKPFVEAGADTRIHDLQFDRNGLQRDSRGVTPRVGATFDVGGKLKGEIAVGYTMRRYDDPTLPELNGFVADGSLAWAATGLTTATLTASSRAEESTVAGVAGTFRRDAGLKIDHAFRRWLIGTLNFGYGLDDYVGSDREDRRTSLGAALAYKFNRDFSLRGEVRQEWMRSNVTGVDYDATVFLIGARLQR